MVWAVQTLTWRNFDKVRAEKTWGEVARIRNTLQEVRPPDRVNNEPEPVDDYLPIHVSVCLEKVTARGDLNE